MAKTQKSMEKIQKSCEVDCPIQTVYNQWTQFEEFPRFMEGVKSVKQLDDKRLHWVAEIGGKEKEWDARIVEQIPDRKIAWTSEGQIKPQIGHISGYRLEPNAEGTLVTSYYDWSEITDDWKAANIFPLYIWSLNKHFSHCRRLHIPQRLVKVSLCDFDFVKNLGRNVWLVQVNFRQYPPE